MDTTSVRAMLLTVGVGGVSTAVGCGNECDQEIFVTLRYDGDEAGPAIVQILNTERDVVAARLGLIEGPFDGPIFSSCRDQDRSPEGEWRAVWWIDTNGDDVEECERSLFPPPCGPEPEEPQAVASFDLREHGTTTIELVAP